MTTPAALLNNIEPNKRRRLEFLRGVKFVVYFGPFRLNDCFCLLHIVKSVMFNVCVKVIA